jgi:hypothetical protein
MKVSFSNAFGHTLQKPFFGSLLYSKIIKESAFFGAISLCGPMGPLPYQILLEEFYVEWDRT